MTELTVANFPFVCRLCANTLANGARKIFDSDASPSNEILEKICNCLPVKVSTWLEYTFCVFLDAKFRREKNTDLPYSVIIYAFVSKLQILVSCFAGR